MLQSVGSDVAALIDAAFVETRLAVSFDASQTLQVEAFIEDASGIVLDVGDSTWTSGTVPDAVAGVVFQMVRRAYTNPDGYQTETIGEYRYGRADDVAAGGIAMTKYEYGVVRRSAGLANVSTVGVRRSNSYERQQVSNVIGDVDGLVL